MHSKCNRKDRESLSGEVYVAGAEPEGSAFHAHSVRRTVRRQLYGEPSCAWKTRNDTCDSELSKIYEGATCDASLE